MKKLLFAIVAGASACYTYAPVGPAGPEAGTEVRAHLRPTQDIDIGEITVRDVSRIDGTVYLASSDTVSVWGQWLYSQMGTRYDPRGAVFYMDRQSVPAFEVRKLNPFRSMVAVAIGVAIGYGIFDFVADPGVGGDNSGGPTGVEAHVVVPIR